VGFIFKVSMRLIFLVLFSFCVNGSAHAISDEELMPTLHVSTFKSAKISKRYKKLLTFAYNQLGYRIQFHEMVAGRALKMIKENQLDALMIQTSTFMKYEDLPVLQIPIVLGKGKLILFCNKGLPCNKAVLQKPDNIIAAPQSTLGLKADFLKMKASSYEIGQKESAGKMFELGRVDYLIEITEDSMGNLGGIDEKKYGQVELATLEGFHYIHKKHEKLIPQLSAAIALYIEEYDPSFKFER